MTINIKGLTVEFNNGTKAIDNLNLNIEKGIYGLLGENGAGKTTLMRVLTTILPVSKGNILINGMKAKNFGSQGQQRSAVLSLKLSEATVLSEILEEKPVLLLDDVLSELDSKRQDYLLNKIDGYQVFITCCEHNDKKQLQDGKLFVVNQGRITEE